MGCFFQKYLYCVFRSSSSDFRHSQISVWCFNGVWAFHLAVIININFWYEKAKRYTQYLQYENGKEKGFQKTVKVTFVKDIPLPTLQRKDIVIQEGMLNLNSSDVESTIKDSLSQLLHVHAAHGSESLKVNLVFLSCSDKMLSLPTVPHGFSWTGEALKANIGQGKLYVMLKDENKQVMLLLLNWFF